MQRTWSALAVLLFAFATVTGAAAMSPSQSLPEHISFAQKVEWQPRSQPGEPAGFRSRAGYPNYGPCGEVKAACRRAGFVSGGAHAGNGLALHCVRPIIEGRPQPGRAIRPLPPINPHLLADCRASLEAVGRRPLETGLQPEPEYQTQSRGPRTQPGYATPPPRYGAPLEEQAPPGAPPPPRYGLPPQQSTNSSPRALPRSGPPQDQSTNGARPGDNAQPEDQDQSTAVAPPQSADAPRPDQPPRPESSGPRRPKNQTELGGPPP